MDMILRILRDGEERLVIVVDGASIEVQEAIIRSVGAAAINPAASPSAPMPLTEQVEGLQPPSIAYETPPTESELEKMEPAVIGAPYKGVVLSSGPYKGKTPYEALDEFRYLALAPLFAMARQMTKNSAERNGIVKDCKSYMANRLRRDTQHITEMFDMKTFMNAVSAMAPMDELANGFGFSSYPELCELGTADDIGRMYESVVLSIENRGRG